MIFVLLFVVVPSDLESVWGKFCEKAAPEFWDFLHSVDLDYDFDCFAWRNVARCWVHAVVQRIIALDEKFYYVAVALVA